MRTYRAGGCWSLCACFLALNALAGCTPPIRQFDLNNRPLTCEQANEYTFKTMQAMGFAITEVAPAAVGRPGTIRGTREEQHATQAVTVTVTCTGTSADVDANEDGRLLGRLDFKRAFYLSFTASAAAIAATRTAAREEAALPPEQQHSAGLQVSLQPVPGLAAMLDFNLDLAAAGVLPVRVTLSNATPRNYRFDPSDIVLMRKDGTRVHPMAVADAARSVIDSDARKAAASDVSPPSNSEIGQRLRTQSLSGDSLSPNQRVKGYVFFPTGEYVKGRITLEDTASEETEGFVVEF